MIKVLVKVWDKVLVSVRTGIHGWNEYYLGSVIVLDFIQNPARSKNAEGHLDKSSVYCASGMRMDCRYPSGSRCLVDVSSHCIFFHVS